MMKKKKLFGSVFFPKPEVQKTVFYAFIDGKQAGPMTEVELKALIKRGMVSHETLVWSTGMVNWTQAQYVPSVNKLLLLFLPKEKQEVREETPIPKNSCRDDLVSAIVGLGFNKKNATNAVEAVLRTHPGISLEDGIKETLKYLSK